MILKKVKLDPFGAASNREFVFETGLNVLLGPNEAGKSTLVNAIFAALFIPSNVRKNSEDWTRLMQFCMPYPQGDTARVELDLISDEGQSIRYFSAWGGRKDERLIFAGGSEINDPDAIRKQLDQVLHFGKGTYQGILFAKQEEMNQTLERLRDNKEANETVAGLLRSALFESGGVSVESLGIAIEREWGRLLSNWDLETDGPRGGKGIGNPHINKVGVVLKAYYDSEKLRRLLRNAQVDETRIIELKRHLDEMVLEQKKLSAQLAEYEKLEDDARKRSVLEIRLEKISDKEEQMKSVIGEWPRVQERVKNAGEAIILKQTDLEKLENELKESLALEGAHNTRELFQKVQLIKADLVKKRAELKELTFLSPADLDYLEDLKRREDQQKAIAGAMKLKAAVSTKKPLCLTITAGLDSPQELTIQDEQVLEGDSRLLIESKDWSIDIQAGQEDVKKILNDAKSCREAFKTKLKELKLTDLDEARVLLSKRNKIEIDLKAAEVRLVDQLGTWDYAELEVAVLALGEDKKMRDPDIIRVEQSALQQAIGKEEIMLDIEKEKLTKWEDEYSSMDEVVSAVADLRRQLEDIRKELKKLAPLPEEYETGDLFIEDLKRMRNKRDHLKDKAIDLKQELLEIQMKMPEESTEELATELSLAEERLDKLKRSGRAVMLVKQEFEVLKEEFDTDTFSPLVEKFGRYLALATANHYKIAEMDGSFPEKITSASGNILPVELLSAGTTNGLALALRLSLASYLLQDRNGFIVMDDPLVHLDPERRKSVANLINQFAEEKQIIITTCDPQTAQLFGGNVVEI